MGRLRDFLASHPRSTLYAVVDAASLPGLLAPMYTLGRGHFSCLLPGELTADVAHVAPYLVSLREGAPLIEWLESRLAQPWGYVIESDLKLLPLQLHLRRFSETRGPRGEVWLFRFWDPRVLRAMPWALSVEQGQAFMQNISCIYLLETGADEPASMRCEGRPGRLQLSGDVSLREQGAIHAEI
jgi:hypothetical protein